MQPPAATNVGNARSQATTTHPPGSPARPQTPDPQLTPQPLLLGVAGTRDIQDETGKRVEQDLQLALSSPGPARPHCPSTSPHQRVCVGPCDCAPATSLSCVIIAHADDGETNPLGLDGTAQPVAATRDSSTRPASLSLSTSQAFCLNKARLSDPTPYMYMRNPLVRSISTSFVGPVTSASSRVFFPARGLATSWLGSSLKGDSASKDDGSQDAVTGTENSHGPAKDNLSGKSANGKPTCTRDEVGEIKERISSLLSNAPPWPQEADGAAAKGEPGVDRIPDGVMRVTVMSIMLNQHVRRPYVVITFGDQAFTTSVASTPSADWCESFEFIVSYHMQLFGTVHFDVYDKNTIMADRFIGRAELALAHLEGFPEEFTNFYEIWDRKQAPSSLPEQQKRSIISKNLGALQVKLTYRHQRFEDPEPPITRTRGIHLLGKTGVDPTQPPKDISTPLDPIEMSMPELLAEFANEYTGYIVEAEKLGHSLIMKGPRRGGSSNGVSSNVGFDRMDEYPDDNRPPEDRPATPGNDNYYRHHQTQQQQQPSMSSWLDFSWFWPTSAAAHSSQQQVKEVPAAADNAGKKSPSDDIPSEPAQNPSRPPGSSSSNSSNNNSAFQDATFIQTLAQMFLAPSTFRAMKSVGSIATSFSQGLEISNSELLGGLVTLNRFYHDLQGRLNEEHAAHRANAALTAGQLKQPARYTRFALASYGWRALYFFNRGVTLIDGAKGNSDVTCMLQYLELAPEDLIGYDFRSSEVFRSSYFVAYDRENDALVLSIRGTMSIKDMLVDLACEYEKWCGGLVHSGMKATAYWLFAKVMPQLLGYAKKQGITSIRLVGHSLGASTAAVLAILLFENRDKLRGLGIDVDALDVQAFCYGAAPCVSRNLAARYEHCIHTFVNGNDIVPRLCYGSFVEFKQLVVAAANETDNLSQRLQSTFQTAEVNQKRWRDKFDRLLKARDNLQQQKNYVYLHLPGSIYHITTDTSGSASDDADRAPHSGRRGEEGNAGDPRASAATAAAAANCHQGDISDGGSRRASEYSRRLSGEKSAQTWVLPASINDFTEVVLRSSMIYEHFPSTYEAAFVRAMQTQAEQQADDASRLSSDR